MTDEEYNQRAVKNLYKDILKYNHRILKVHIVDGEEMLPPHFNSWPSPCWVFRQGTRQIIVEMNQKRRKH